MPMTANVELPEMSGLGLSSRDHRAMLEEVMLSLAEDVVAAALRDDHPLRPDGGVRVVQRGRRVKLVVATSAERHRGEFIEAYLETLKEHWGWRRWWEWDEFCRLAVEEQIAKVGS